MRTKPLMHNYPLWLKIPVALVGLALMVVFVFPLMALMHFSPNCRDGYWSKRK